MAGQDLGTDTGSAAFSIGTKLGEALIKVLEKSFQEWQNSPYRKLEKQKLKEARTITDKAKIISKLDNKSQINFEKLKVYARVKNDTCCSTGISLKSEEDMNDKINDKSEESKISDYEEFQ